MSMSMANPDANDNDVKNSVKFPSPQSKQA